jgi:hypothetical protein
MKQADRRKACKKANDSGQHNQPQVVLAAQAGQDSEHCYTRTFQRREDRRADFTSG